MQVLLWSWWWDSNSWPHPYQGCALPPVPHQHSILSDSSVMIPHSEAFCKPFFEKNRHLWLCTIQHCCFGFQTLIYHIDARLSEKTLGNGNNNSAANGVFLKLSALPIDKRESLLYNNFILDLHFKEQSNNETQECAVNRKDHDDRRLTFDNSSGNRE